MKFYDLVPDFYLDVAISLVMVMIGEKLEGKRGFLHMGADSQGKHGCCLLPCSQSGKARVPEGTHVVVACEARGPHLKPKD